jgi:hypothetical protein
LPFRRCDGSKAQRDETIHGEFQPLVELAVNATDAEYLGNFTPGEGNRLLEIVLERQHAQGDKDIQVLFSG